MKKRILIIDDEQQVRDLIQKILTRAGYIVFTASDGREGIEKLESIYVDLIILDMYMPNMNGLEVLHYIKEKNLSNKPVLMLSGNYDAELRIECYKAGVYDFIAKPEQPEVILKRIENGLKLGELIEFNEFMKIELFMAKKLQKYIFPEPDYTAEGINIHCWTLPLSDIGGDLFDYIHFRNNSLMFFVADVSGHSISASMFTAIVKMVFRNALKISEDPGEILTIMNNELSEVLPTESFVTMFCGIIDCNSGHLRYSNAGHPTPYLIKSDTYEPIPGSDPFLGPIKNTKYETRTMTVSKGESLFIYTDGLNDLFDDNYNKINVSFFLETILENKVQDEIVQSIASEISSDRFIRTDDCTVMLIKKQ